MVNIVNDKVFHFDINGCDNELKLINIITEVFMVGIQTLMQELVQ